MMNEMIAAFPAQLQEALEIGRKASISVAKDEIHHILICGMGGSGIGGDFMHSWLKDECTVPISISKDYTIPSFVNKHTIAIVSSYSGQTEETLSSLTALGKTEAQIVSLSSGGAIMDRAKEKGYDYIEIPGGWESPRACLGFSLVLQLFTLYKKGLISDAFEKEISAGIQLMENDRDAIEEKAGHIAQMLSNKLPVLYCANQMTPVALRWRQQFNENAKSLCWHNSFPEMNHNELVGWKGQYNNLAVVVLRNRKDHARTQMRIQITKEILAHSAGTYMEIWSKGKSLIEQSLYLVHLGDWVSWHLAQLKEVDAVEVKVIDYLKSELAKN